MKREYIWLVRNRDGDTIARFIKQGTLRFWLTTNLKLPTASPERASRIDRQPADPGEAGRLAEYVSTPADFWHLVLWR